MVRSAATRSAMTKVPRPVWVLVRPSVSQERSASRTTDRLTP